MIIIFDYSFKFVCFISFLCVQCIFFCLFCLFCIDCLFVLCCSFFCIVCSFVASVEVITKFTFYLLKKNKNCFLIILEILKNFGKKVSENHNWKTESFFISRS